MAHAMRRVAAPAANRQRADRMRISVPTVSGRPSGCCRLTALLMPTVSRSADSPSDPLAALVGYLNFSAGAADAAAWQAASKLFAGFEPPAADGTVVEQVDTASRVATVLRQELARLAQNDPALFRNRICLRDR